MDAARQHALHWAFFMDIMDMSFDDIFDMFSAWYDSLPEDKMAEIMDLADGTTDNGNTKDIPENIRETDKTKIQLKVELGMHSRRP